MKFLHILKHFWLLLCILFTGLFFGLYQLNSIPGEMWGDATAHYKLAQIVQAGHPFFNYKFGGDGPIYTYLVVLVATFLGLSFYTLKLTSVFIYLGFIFVMYFLGYELSKNKKIAYMSSFLAAVSFWSVTFARQPHARMLVPFFIALTILFALKKKNIISGILLGIGMYTQASIWALPFIFYKRLKIFFIGLLVTIPLIIFFFTSSIGFLSNKSYFGEKLATTSHLSLFTTIKIICSNILSNMLSFNFTGDRTFRVNVPGTSHLDFVSGIFFLVGFALILYKTYKDKNKQLLQYLILPFFIIQIPSFLDIHNSGAQPNIGRMIGVIPFVYISIAYGIDIVTTTLFAKLTLKTHQRKTLSTLFIIVLLFLIALTNFTKYFFEYPLSLPNHNVPFARIIAESIDKYSPDINVIILGSGWGQWQQPELAAIADSLTKQRTLYSLPENIDAKMLCQQIARGDTPTVIITRPTNTIVQKEIKQCATMKDSVIIRNNPLYDVAKEMTVTSK